MTRSLCPWLDILLFNHSNTSDTAINSHSGEKNRLIMLNALTLFTLHYRNVHPSPIFHHLFLSLSKVTVHSSAYTIPFSFPYPFHFCSFLSLPCLSQQIHLTFSWSLLTFCSHRPIKWRHGTKIKDQPDVDLDISLLGRSSPSSFI